MADLLPFRFDAGLHEYTSAATGVVYPNITKMLAQTGWVDDRWFTEEAAARGTAVHRLTADYDLGGLDIVSAMTIYRGYLNAHVSAVGVVQPEWIAIEEPAVHQALGFAGRPDRVAMVFRMRSVWEIKTGQRSKADPIQTALQALLDSYSSGIPPDAYGRYCCYLKWNGKYDVHRHLDSADFSEAYRIVRACC